MKKRKFSIWLNVVTICLSICAIAIGVYSIKNSSMKISGSIGFVASYCNVKITPSITGYTADGNKQTYTEETFEIGGTTHKSSGELTLQKVYFSDAKDDGNVVTISLKIENLMNIDVLASIKELFLKQGETEIANSVVKKQVKNGTTTVGNYANVKLEKKSTITLTITLTATDLFNTDATVLNDSKFSININFNKYAEGYLAPNWKNLVFTDTNGNENGFCSTSNISELIFTDTIPEDCEDKTISVGTSALDTLKNDSTTLNNVEDVIAYGKKNTTTNKYSIYLYSPGITFISNKTTSDFDTLTTILNDGYQFSGLNMSTLDFGNSDFSKVTNMYGMFGCSTITNFELKKIDTSNATNFSYMFVNSGYTNLDLSYFNTSKVIDMSYMFLVNQNLTSFDLSSFDTSNVTNMSYMFDQCYSIKSINLSNFDTSNVTNMSSMFSECYVLENLDLSNFDTSKVTNMNAMFYRCYALTNIDLSSFKTSNVTNMSYMFSVCGKLSVIYVNSSKWKTSQVTSSVDMFAYCENLPNYNDEVIDKTNAHTGSGGYLTEKA